MTANDIITEFERLIRRDPGGRGLLGPDAETGLGLGELAAAAELLVRQRGAVCLVTGFFIPTTQPNSEGPRGFAETDGPLGTALLASILSRMGRTVRVVTDENCGDVVRIAMSTLGLATETVLVAPLQSSDWRREFWASSFGRQLQTLVAIERVGPSHTLESFDRANASQNRRDDFAASVDEADRGHCFNMRGLNIDEFTGDLHALFDEFPIQHPDGVTIGVGDGGNEIGMGRFAWSELRRRLPPAVGAKIPCRIATDSTVLAGTSNWGAYALAAAACVLTSQVELLQTHTVQSQFECLEAIVRDGFAVDGVTRRQEATVDGLPFLTYIQPWSGILRLVSDWRAAATSM